MISPMPSTKKVIVPKASGPAPGPCSPGELKPSSIGTAARISQVTAPITTNHSANTQIHRLDRIR